LVLSNRTLFSKHLVQ